MSEECPGAAEPGCCCAEIDPSDRPCIVCEARSGIAVRQIAEHERAVALEAAPAFELVTATLWSLVVHVKTEPPTANPQRALAILTADPTGAEAFAVARTIIRREVPTATAIHLVHIQCQGEVGGTVIRLPARS